MIMWQNPKFMFNYDQFKVPLGQSHLLLRVWKKLLSKLTVEAQDRLLVFSFLVSSLRSEIKKSNPAFPQGTIATRMR